MTIGTAGPVGRLMIALGAMALGASSASAQVLGTFTWQMQPYCNKVTVTLTTVATGYMLHGFDDECGAGPRGSAVGTVVLNPNGSASVNFTIDSFGNAGSFALGGAMPGLPPRPLAPTPRNVAENPLEPNDRCLTLPQPTMTLCGKATGYWVNGGFGVPGLQVWRDGEGRVHLRGSVSRVNISSAGVVFVLPPEFRPPRLLSFPVGTGASAGVHLAGVAVMAIQPSGAVFFFSMSQPTDTAYHLGELVFSVDQ